MIILEGIMHRKVKWWITFVIVIILVIIAALAISAKAANWTLGGEVVSYIPACSAASPTPTCPGIPCKCLRCGCVWAPCVPPTPPKWSEILIRPMGRSMQYSCPPIGFKYSGVQQVPSPKKKILGFGMSAYAPFRTGLGR